jgi:pre-mRNA-splicing factor SPF27
LKEELKKASEGQTTSAIDTGRFRLDPPKPLTNPDEQVASWKSAVNNSRAQLEHQQSRLLNLELINQFGANAWKLHNFQLEAEVKRLQEELQRRKQEIQDLNKQRKLDQVRRPLPVFLYRVVKCN